MNARTRLITPVAGADLPGLLQRLIFKFVPGFRIATKTNKAALIEHEFSGVLIRRVRDEHSYENSDEPWWPASHSWECFVTGIPGVKKFHFYAGTSSPGADETYNYFELVADEDIRKKMENEWRGIQLNYAIKDRKAIHSELMPQEWRNFFSQHRQLSFTGAFDWLRDYPLVQGEDTAPLTFTCEGKGFLATDEGEIISIRGAIPADLKTVKETRQRHVKGAEPYGLELALNLLPGERNWREVFHDNAGTCFLGTAWGEKIATRAWQNENWLMRQSIGGNKWGGLRSAYWLQPVAFAESARFSLLALFEIYGGGATMSYDPAVYNTQYFYTVVGGIHPAEKTAFLEQLNTSLNKEGWHKEN